MVNSKLLLTLGVASTGVVAVTVGQCNVEYNECRTAPGANMAVCASERAACVAGVSKRADVVPTTGGPVAVYADGTGCTKQYNECRSAPDANMSTCAAERAECTGESDNDSDDEDDDNSSSTATASASSSSTSSGSEDCETKFNECRSAPGANMAVCAAEHSKCKGESGSSSRASASTTGATSGPTETAAASGTSSGSPSSATPRASATETGAAGRLEVSGSMLAAFVVALGLF